jgi:hypothetical protein
MKNKQYISKCQNVLKLWAKEYYLQLFILNLIIMGLVLLRSAQYFDPFFLISINSIFFVCLVLSIFLFKAKSQLLFFVALVFWLTSMMYNILGINIWAERSSVYVFQSLFLGSVVYIGEELFRRKRKKT